MKKIAALFFVILTIGFTGCATSEIAGKGNSAIDAKAHVNSNAYGFKLLFGETLFGTPTIDDAVSELTQTAKDLGSSNVKIVQSSSSNYWWILPPITIIINPVISNVAADVK